MWKGANELEGFFRQFLRLYRPLITNLNELLAPYKLTYSLWQVIFYLKNYGPSTLVEVSGYYNVEKPTITRRVHRLEELQMVRQIPGKDRREKIIELTEWGEEIYQTCRLKITDLENQVMKGIPYNEQSITFQTLPKIRDQLMKGEDHKHE